MMVRSAWAEHSWIVSWSYGAALSEAGAESLVESGEEAPALSLIPPFVRGQQQDNMSRSDGLAPERSGDQSIGGGSGASVHGSGAPCCHSASCLSSAVEAMWPSTMSISMHTRSGSAPSFAIHEWST